MNINFKRMTKKDYMAYLSTERFEDGTEAVIGECENAIIVIDKCCIQIEIIQENDKEWRTYCLENGDERVNTVMAYLLSSDRIEETYIRKNMDECF